MPVLLRQLPALIRPSLIEPRQLVENIGGLILFGKTRNGFLHSLILRLRHDFPPRQVVNLKPLDIHAAVRAIE